MRNLIDEFGLVCRSCGQAEHLEISIRCSAVLTNDGSEPFGDHEWDDTSFCRCPVCGFAATVAAFTQPSTPIHQQKETA